ncbi:hypothetical protein M0654_03855 [Rhizobium sp. NTR19]|uniref:Uncharacterized protein n=1 Tax=Neorhizobium turbinariae TaxID=2937795 RepID=A0ABT0IMK8_9HYPH|nr:hypothetical protein [Neorhizobium turbinariae]MCK8779114.1 hypothetical protein [Neorhizobium turbinariae]
MIATTYDPKPLAPADLAMIQRVLEAACQRRGLSKEGNDAAHIAAELVELYAHGVRGEQELSALIS